MSLLRLVTLVGLIAGGAVSAEAQIRVGPLGGVRVRSPGADLRIGPLGRVRGRGPLRNLLRADPVIVAPVPRPLSRSTPIPPPVYPPPRYQIPSYDEVTRKAENFPSPQRPAPTLARRLEDAARQLRHDLQGHPEEDAWVGYLQPAAIESVASRLSAGDDVSSEQVLGLLGNFDGVAANPDLELLNTMPGFVKTREMLRRLAVAKGDRPAEEAFVAPDAALIDDPEWKEDLSGFDLDYEGLDSTERRTATPPPAPTPPRETQRFETLPLPEPDPTEDSTPESPEPRVIRAEV